MKTMWQLLDFLREERRLWRHYLRSRYGIGFRYVIGPGDALAGRRVVVETHEDGGLGVHLPEEGEPPPERFDKWVLVAPERLPRTRSGWLDMMGATRKLELWNTAWSLMNDLGVALKDMGCDEKVIAESACKMYLHVTRQDIIFYARHIEPGTGELSQLTREVAAAVLTGWMRARTSLTRNKRLREVLTEGGDPDQEAKVWLEKLTEVDQERRSYQRLAAKGHMTDEELDEELAELAETRKIAERELEALCGRRERIEEMERDRDALLDNYARRAPEALNVLAPEERNQVYRILRLQAAIMMDGMLDVSGTFGEGDVFCPTTTPPLSRFKSTKQTELKFRALLTEGAREVRFEHATMS